MSVFASLLTSSQAMATQSHVMERISDNVANMNTIGYKSFDAHLRDTINHVTGQGDTFLSVSAVDIRRAEAQGIVQSTGRPLDVALNGQGFFITNPAFDGSGEQHFTRAGSTTTGLGDDGNSYLVNSSGQFYQGWALDADGGLDTSGPLGPIQIDNIEGLPGEPTTEVAFSGNVDANATQSRNFEVSVWSSPDAAGDNDPYALVMTWTPGAPNSNAWTVSYTVRGPDGTSTPLPETTAVQFDGLGQYVSPPDPAVISVPFANGTSSSISVDLSHMTQFGGGGFVENWQEGNGYPEGRVSNTAFDNRGRLMVQYSNGQSRALYQLAVADFPAPQKLDDAGSTMFTYNPEAGAPEIYAAQAASTRTAIVSGSVEASTVDVAKEFTNMITTQKAYSTSATVFRTSDEMMQTASGLKR
ncbi:flagellar hook protein FlgE [Roseospira navarrensis]|uniref:Flagellar hook-basal body complex protein n=1 Tax=Roseospira navarrensis TaxID=140058 RepID=A0A7X1ZI86_9PROT|nr:flagellar hook-basal body complex protein [Roseospira navarrensis]MQX37937.1 flagellar hook-basal body complex protein [Roseospira navarrensis]